MNYLDFDLLIEHTASGYRAHVLNSPAGQAAAGFPAPFSAQELRNFRKGLGRGGRVARSLSWDEPEAATATAEEFGGRLFATVFAADVRNCLLRSLDEAQRQGAGLRIRLRLSDVSELADVPWEYLYDATAQRFLCLSTQTPVVRYLELPERVQPFRVKPPLRILVMIASPADYPQLDVEREWRQLCVALDDLQGRQLITLDLLETATQPALQRRLRQGEFHIFHYIGHGAFDQQAQNGMLIMEDEAKQSMPVSSRNLATLLRDEPSLRLVVLNACEGAVTSTTDQFAGTAQRLVQQGIPAVVAMQFAITDQAAIAFGHTFYASVADDYPVDAALSEARKAIFTQGNALEWAVPVLYMRSPDGVIWQMESKEAEFMDQKPGQAWWDTLPAEVGGDVIIAEVGAGARGVAVGKNITQAIYDTWGEPTPDDRHIIERRLSEVMAALQKAQGQLDAGGAMMAQFQVKLLQGELTKTEEGETPSASTITQVGDWLLDNVPQIAEALLSLFATPAVGKVVGKAGEAAVGWAKKRFGGNTS
ncbi:MAG: CHAT domain-containing protein [Chloroflexota bacterium]|nr:CHAT domain-containing protein [Chloroflexota bacterium]